MNSKSIWGALRWTELWSDRWRLIRSTFWARPLMRLDNRWQDLRAALAGSCNASTWTGEPPYGYAGGYSHWRCGKRRGHHLEVPRGVMLETGDYGPHRFNNYVWGGPGTEVEYAPIEIGGGMEWDAILPFSRQSAGRRSLDTMRRSRLRSKWIEEERIKRKADRA